MMNTTNTKPNTKQVEDAVLLVLNPTSPAKWRAPFGRSDHANVSRIHHAITRDGFFDHSREIGDKWQQHRPVLASATQAQVRNAIKRLEARDEVERVGRGTRGAEYRLVTDEMRAARQKAQDVNNGRKAARDEAVRILREHGLYVEADYGPMLRMYADKADWDAQHCDDD